MEVPFYMANNAKNNDWKTLLPQQTNSKESFTLIVQYPGTTPVQYFPKLKNPDGSNVIGEDGRPKRSQEPQGWTYLFIQFGTGDRVRVVLDNKYELNPGVLYEVQALGYHFSREHSYYLDELNALAVVHDFAGAGNDSSK
jgi:hypothetical protein